VTSKQVVIITGVSSGIGLATALHFVQQGWIVVGTVRSKDYPAELATAAVDVQLAEMTQPGDIERVVKNAHKTYGRIDAVVANAGYALLGPFQELTHDQISQQMAVNVVAVSDLIRLALPHMRKRGSGTLVATSSVAGRVGIPGYSAYSASKFALEGMLESLSYELGDTNIKVRLIEPSSVKTPFWTRGVIRAGIKKSSKSSSMSRAITGGKFGWLTSDRVAKVIYRAATSKGNKLHYPVGISGPTLLIKKLLPDRLFRKLYSWFV
jgi:NAD(P)-dependent dehydrogenase (short-subunit alcohol dehydrogenase family)